MQTAMRIQIKSKCQLTEELVAQFLHKNKITVCPAAPAPDSQKGVRSLHIGKNCATRWGARV
jgi:hypothetical protein